MYYNKVYAAVVETKPLSHHSNVLVILTWL